MRFKQIVPFVFYIRTGNVAASLVHGRRNLLPNILLLDLPGLHLLFMIDICGNEKFGPCFTPNAWQWSLFGVSILGVSFRRASCDGGVEIGDMTVA